MRRSSLTLAVLLVVTGLVLLAAHDRARRELVEARNQALREDLEANARFIARMAYLAREKRALDEVQPEHSRILPVAALATDERLLRDFQDMQEATGVRIVSVSIGVPQ